MSSIQTRKLSLEHRPGLATELGVGNVHAVPLITKVSINVGLGQARQDKNAVAYITASLAKITGQKPVQTYARNSIAGFKLRAGDLVGIRVTLRAGKMYDFLDRLLNVTLPRIREFRGIIPSAFDRSGNLTIGFKDQSPFAELGHDVLEKSFGLSMTISISNSTPEQSQIFLSRLGFPFKTI